MTQGGDVSQEMFELRRPMERHVSDQVAVYAPMPMSHAFDHVSLDLIKVLVGANFGAIA
jgi:hypothetical protein